MAGKNFPLLLYLVKKCGLQQPCTTSTTELSKEFGCSQQTISRKLRQLEAEGFIERMPHASGTEVLLTQKSAELMKSHLKQIERLFQEKTSGKLLSGVVESGLGEGGYYVSLPQYKKQFRKKLGFAPFPGTLNLRINEFDLQDFTTGKKPLRVEGFESRRRTFGGIDCYRVRVGSYKQLALIVPERSSHRKNVAELIAPDYLRERFNLKDGKRLTLTI